MGNTVDRQSLEEIRADYGPNGLLGYDLVNGCADVTSYTQLAAFSANGLLMGLTRGMLQGKLAPLVRYIGLALREWSCSQHNRVPERIFCWLSYVPELKRRHCMDTWMLSTLSGERLGSLEEPVNCLDNPAALTTVISVALLSEELGLSREEACRLGAEAVALTHGAPEAFLSGAVLTNVFRAILSGEEVSPRDLVADTVSSIQQQFGREYGQTTHIWELLQLALTLADSDSVSPMEAMEQLRCRTAPEVLAGVLYACARCGGDFDTAMILAVNHSGRSAAVGAITGAILGATLGESALPEFYMECLEPADVLRELADDLVQGCPMVQKSKMFDDTWDQKYVQGKRVDQTGWAEE
jgi:ADP-ribosylglycohydrolase